MNYKLDAVRNVRKDIDIIINKRILRKSKLNSTELSVKIAGEEYKSYNDVMDAYGCGIISEKQKDRALYSLEHQLDKTRLVEINYEIGLLRGILDLLIDTENRMKEEK